MNQNRDGHFATNPESRNGFRAGERIPFGSEARSRFRSGGQRRATLPNPGDRVMLLSRDGSPTRQRGLVRETRRVPNPFGGAGQMWARVQWDNGAGAWMAIGRSLVVLGGGELGSTRR